MKSKLIAVLMSALTLCVSATASAISQPKLADTQTFSTKNVVAFSFQTPLYSLVLRDVKTLSDEELEAVEGEFIQVVIAAGVRCAANTACRETAQKAAMWIAGGVGFGTGAAVGGWFAENP
ncbi:hypothetical protein [Deinococcus indicus]|uniref:hypothetical protein n=1 Tax=Deinococcus indicus TaxID=223556 RepID=UPI001178B169|nr:hypothetical protein [Deinococcus indicus]